MRAPAKSGDLTQPWRPIPGPEVDAAGVRIPKRPRLAVLFVHGMGEQQRGETLTDMGDALLDWLRRWLDPARSPIASTPSRVNVLDSSLRQPDDDLPGTAHIALTIRDGSSNVGVLLAESWWADTFPSPNFNEFAAWGFLVGPWIAATQYHGAVRRLRIDPSTNMLLQLVLRPLAAATMVILAFAAMILSFFIFLLAIGLVILRAVPLGFVQSMAEGLARVLAGGFGDAFVLVRSPARFAAMAGQVREDIAILRQEADRVIVVAHSQGSQVAWEAIRRTPADDADATGRELGELVTFITFGQALRKLKVLYHLARQDWTWSMTLRAGLMSLTVVAAMASIVAFVMGLVAWAGGEDARAPFVPQYYLVGASAVALAVTFAFYWLQIIAARGWDRTARTQFRGELRLLGERPALRWIDLWGSADPFPNGPLLDDLPARVETYRIRTVGSPLFDHTSYFQNGSEFVSAIAFPMLTAAFGYGSASVRPAQLRLAALRRSIRVVGLSVMRTAAAFGAMGLLLAYWQDVLEVAGSIIAAAENLPLVGESISDAPDWIDVPIGLIGAALLAGFVWRAVFAVWRGGAAQDARDFFAWRLRPIGCWPNARLLLFSTIVSAAGPTWLAVAGGQRGSIGIAVVMLALPLICAQLLFLSGGGRNLAEDMEDGVPVLPGPWAWVIGLAIVTGVCVAGLLFVPDPSSVPFWVRIVYLAATIPMLIAVWWLLVRFRQRYAGVLDAARAEVGEADDR